MTDHYYHEHGSLVPAVEFTVWGIPAPKGSKSAFPIRRKGGGIGVAVVEGKTARQADWLRTVDGVVQGLAVEGAQLLDVPLEIRIDFYLPKPVSAPKRKRTWPSKKPDLDKLARAIFDALTDVIVTDDARFIHADLRKWYAEDSPDPRPRAEVSIWTVAPEAASLDGVQRSPLP